MLESLNQENLFRGPNSSSEFNQRNETIRKDINRAYQLLNANDVAIKNNMDIVLRENFFLQNTVTTLENEIERLESLIGLNKETPDGVVADIYHEQFYQTKNVINGQNNKASLIDRTHGVVTPLPTNSSSKLTYETENGTLIQPKGLEVFIKEAKNTNLDAAGNLVYYDVQSDNVNLMVDRREDTFWVRQVSFPTKDSVTEVFGELHIRMPIEGVTNLYANTLVLHPYPEGSMRIRDIQYKGVGNQWSRLENYPTEIVESETVPKTIDNARKLMFQFARTEVIELRIFYSQPYWFEDKDKSIFAYGFQSVDLMYNLYTEKNCEFITVVDLSDKNSLFYQIDEPEIIPAPGTYQNLTNLISHHLYYDDSMIDEFDFNTTILPDIDKAYIKTVLHKQGDTVPVIKEIRVPFSFKAKQ